ncbi:MAG: DUF3857 domain-containing protein [Acidobacteriota bacterium]|nr:DUF3857 domain-containing protein [Acidobacteriota bacterium]
MPIHRLRRVSLFLLLIGVLGWAWCPQAAHAVSSATVFRPVNPEELKMTAEPAAPGAPAVILFREVYRDDNVQTGHEDDYFRIKILTEEGRKYADVEIPYSKDVGDVNSIRGRTIKPDGSIVDFEGKAFTKSIIKARGVKELAKTFTLPAVQPGCIIEYYYTINLKEWSLFDSHWILSHELYTKAAQFSLKPYLSDNSPYRLRWVGQNLPPGTGQAQAGADQIVRLHAANIPAFQKEDLMPPENEMKSRVDFIYSEDLPEADLNRFWSKVGKRLNNSMESFVGKRKGMEQAVAEIVGPNDPPEVKLQKIYARVQQMRNTSFETFKTEEERKREKQKAPSNAEEAWKRGYGSGTDLTWLYLALVNAAGFEAYGVIVPDREHYFFNPNAMQSDKLDENLVLIKLNGKEIFCDPGSAFTPYGLLPWPETGVRGLQLDKKESTWVPSLTPTSAQARTERHADLTLTDTGDLEGKVTVTYTGLESSRLRLDELRADETERKTLLEDILKQQIPAASEVKLINQPEWKNSALPLAAEFSIKVPGWATGAGRHVIVPVGLFSAREKHLFDHADRVHPIYVDYPYMEADDINIQIPAGWQVSSLPKGWNDTGRVVSYTLKADSDKGKVHLARTMTVDFIFMEVKYYGPLRSYFQEIKTNDDQQIVLDPAATRAGN